MRKVFIIAKREYLERVRTKSFIVMTFLIPALMLAVTIMPSRLMMKGSGGTKHLMVVASDARTADLIRDQLLKLAADQKSQPSSTELGRDNAPPIGTLLVDVDGDTSDAEHAALAERVKDKKLDGVIFATKDALAQKKIPFLTRDVSSFMANSEIKRGVNEALRRDLFKSKGMTDQEIDAAILDVDLNTESPTGKSNPQVVFITVLSMAMILYMVTLLYGINVMRAILEEKTSRVMEVMLSTAKANEMMAGKILGVSAVGLTQIGIWVLVAIIATTGGMIAVAGTVKGILSAKLLVSFAVFFLLGFVLYSTLCAAVGAMVNSEQEAQQLQFIVMLPMIISVIIMVSIIQNPASSTAVWASIFPLTAPLIMFLRVALQAPSVWEIATSIALMVATIYGLAWVCGRIYRVGILMYGKKPTLPEIMKWIRYA